MPRARRSLLTIVATAPVRVCDAGGWTDTWFAGSGLVCNLAVQPGVRVEVTGREDELVTYAAEPTPLLAATVAEAGATGIHVAVSSAVPAASSLGTSAAVTVALLAALGVAVDDLPARAHRVETEGLGLQSGVQDQVAATYGGASLIEVSYPRARRIALPLPPLRLVTVFLGPHRSSAVHDRVVAELTSDSTALDDLRACARDAAAALEAGDVRAYGAALVRNTEAQRALHPSLVSGAADEVIAAARAVDAIGWKVNGAGGEGGTVTIVCGEREPAITVGSIVPLEVAPYGVRVTG